MKGGGVARLPVLPTTVTVQQLQREWDFKYISGHGALNNKIFVVPENTYIYFTTTAGEIASIEELVHIHNFIYNVLGTNASLASWWAETLRVMKGAGLFSEEVYNATKAPANEYNFAKKRAFYQPGDLIQDISIRFKNNKKNIFPVGAFQIPIAGSLKLRVDEFNENETSEFDDNTTDSLFFNIPSNLFRRKIFVDRITTSTLFDSVNDLGNLGGKKRLIIVDTCRVPTFPHNANGAVRPAEKTLVRSLSVSGRSYAPTCALPPTVNTVNMAALRNILRRIGLPAVNSPEQKLKKAIDDLIAGLFDEDDERQQADRKLLVTVLEKSRSAELPIRGGGTKRQRRKKKQTRRK